jgi:hypothetical protein
MVGCTSNGLELVTYYYHTLCIQYFVHTLVTNNN